MREIERSHRGHEAFSLRWVDTTTADNRKNQEAKEFRGKGYHFDIKFEKLQEIQMEMF